MADICKTDILRAVSYLEEAARLYSSLPRQNVSINGRSCSILKLIRMPANWGAGKCRCRAHMIRELTEKLKTKLYTRPNDPAIIQAEKQDQ